jgi:hypothetical protein
MTKRTAARSYILVFLVLWAISAAVWLVAFKAPLAALVAPIAPIFFGCLLLASSSPGVGLFSVAVAGIAAAPITLSLIREPRLPIVVIAHVTLAAYWFWSFALLGAGV